MGLAFTPSTHRYELDGSVVPSVTGILKASNLVRFDDAPPSILEAARQRGTAVHQAIHYDNERDLDRARFMAEFPTYAGYLRAWITFVEQRKFVPKLCEYRVASRRYQVAGTIDCLGVLDGHGALLDFATGRPQDVSKDLQTAGYLGLAWEWADGDFPLKTFFDTYGPVVRRYAIALKADGSFGVHAYADPSDWRHFLTLVEAQRIIAARSGEAWSEVAA
jgi:hypothetical protein